MTAAADEVKLSLTDYNQTMTHLDGKYHGGNAVLW